MTPTPDSEEAADLLYNVVKNSRRVLDERLSVHGLSAARAKVLAVVGTKGPMRQGEIATMFDLAPRTVTELVDALERDGLVERREDVTDRRAREVHLTAAGKDAMQDVLAARDEVVDFVLDALGPARLRDLVGTLQMICERITALDTSGEPTINLACEPCALGDIGADAT